MKFTVKSALEYQCNFQLLWQQGETEYCCPFWMRLNRCFQKKGRKRISRFGNRLRWQTGCCDWQIHSLSIFIMASVFFSTSRYSTTSVNGSYNAELLNLNNSFVKTFCDKEINFPFCRKFTIRLRGLPKRHRNLETHHEFRIQYFWLKNFGVV